MNGEFSKRTLGSEFGICARKSRIHFAPIFGFLLVGMLLGFVGSGSAQPVIVTAPTNLTVIAGGVASFNVAVSGTGPFSSRTNIQVKTGKLPTSHLSLDGEPRTTIWRGVQVHRGLTDGELKAVIQIKSCSAFQ